MAKLTHFNEDGRPTMVDVSDKDVTLREATATGVVRVSPDTYELIMSGGIAKGDVLGAAQVAGIMGAKRTPDLIPMCHPISITKADISFAPDAATSSIGITATVRCKGETGVEMEALTAVSVAALTIYDMCKAVQRDITIENIRLTAKSGGKSGDYRADL
jgi:cyclic pyranopterin phosphate synthase